MPQFVHTVTSKGYSLIEPRLDWARGKVSLLDGVVVRLESIVPPLINGTDKIIDSTTEAVYTCTEPVIVGVSTRLEPITTGAYNRSLSLVDASESLIDRLLPVPVKASKSGDEEDDAQSPLIARVAYLPFRAPVRITMIMFVSASGAVQTVYVSARGAAGVAYEKQQQFAQAVMERAKPLTDRVGAMSEATLSRARAGRDAVALRVNTGTEYVTVMVNGMLVRFKLVEAKDWTVDKLGRLRAGTVAVAVAGVQLACNTTGFVIGKSRATYVFKSLALPVEDVPENQVSDVSDTAPGAPPKPVVKANTEPPKAGAKLTAPKVAEVKVGGKITEAKAPAVANGAIAG